MARTLDLITVLAAMASTQLAGRPVDLQPLPRRCIDAEEIRPIRGSRHSIWLALMGIQAGRRMEGKRAKKNWLSQSFQAGL